jgi:Fur family ferric uptake transcriptional regulator
MKSNLELMIPVFQVQLFYTAAHWSWFSGCCMDKKQLQAAGLKATAPRMRILRLFESATEPHLSAESIYTILKDGGDDIALATVYRVLSQFEAAGVLIRHHFEEGFSVFELNHGEHHDHLICVKCRKVVEFVNEMIEEQQTKIAEQHGFILTDHSLKLFGLCEGCQGD